MVIENSKIYNVNDVEKIFFRPTFCGKSAEELGIRVIYNMPIPTTVPMLSHNSNILKGFSSGWQGGSASIVDKKEINLTRLKAESAYSAEDYFSTIYEIMTNSSDVAMGDLTGTELEAAETELFRRAIAESVYAAMWFGDTNGELSTIGCFDGFMRHIINSSESGTAPVEYNTDEQTIAVTDILHNAWSNAGSNLRALASEGNLVFFVSSDIYDAYQFYLDNNSLVNSTVNVTTGRPVLSYHGIQVVEIPSQKYSLSGELSFCILTDRRNFILALNTADSPEKEVRMWYNPDEMENRQRVVFLAGTAVADETLVSGSVYGAGLIL